MRDLQQLTRAVMKLAILATVALPSRSHAEVRSVWSSRFGWPSSTVSGSKTNINNLMNNMVTGRFNTVFFQIRGQCDVFYSSPYEPWSPIISEPDGVHPGWDPLQYAITAAQTRGLKLHAYFNTHTIWQGAAPNITRYPTHIYYQHGNPNDPAHQDWMIHDASGNPALDGEYIWMNPGIPAADAHVRREAVYIVSNYDVDGLHFDRCRMPQPGYGKNPIAVARWDNPLTTLANDGPGNPERLSWDAYMRDCVTRQMINITGQCWLANRKVLMSAAPLGLRKQSDYPGYPSYFQYGYERAQDAAEWMHKGALDFVVPQIYWSNTDAGLPDFDDVYDGWITHANAAGRALVPGSNLSKGLTEVQSHALYQRANGGAGHCVWHAHNTAINWMDWSTAGKPYAGAAVPFPAFPWRDTEGVITGHVYVDPAGTTPAVDAWVTRTGSTWTALSSGDGFFSFLRVPPGTYTLTIRHPSLGPTGTKTISNVVVTAGYATDVSAMLPVNLSAFSLN